MEPALLLLCASCSSTLSRKSVQDFVLSDFLAAASAAKTVARMAKELVTRIGKALSVQSKVANLPLVRFLLDRADLKARFCKNKHIFSVSNTASSCQGG